MNKKNLPVTENLNEKIPFIDELSLLDGFRLMLNDQKLTKNNLEEEKIYKIIDVLANHLSKYKNSNFYCGAGTSGRIGVQDGADYPTWLANLDMILLLQVGKSFNSFN